MANSTSTWNLNPQVKNEFFGEQLLQNIYLAGARPDGWLALLEELSTQIGAKGANLIRQRPEGLQMHSTPAVKEATARFHDEGWAADNSRVSRLLDRMPYPGFLADCDIHSAQELQTMPMYADFLQPRGFAAGAATIVQGAAHDAVILAFEGFASHPASKTACHALDELRPHLARALVLSQEVEVLQARTVLESFEVMGLAVALLASDGGLIDTNTRFREQSEPVLRRAGRMIEARGLRARGALDLAVRRCCAEGQGDSIALHDHEGRPGAVLHLVPYAVNPRGISSSVAAFALLAEAKNDALPRSDIIAALFDLTPAEARVARALARGKSLGDIALELRISVETVRTHLKRAFAKAGVTRQSELVAVMARFQ